MSDLRVRAVATEASVITEEQLGEYYAWQWGADDARRIVDAADAADPLLPEGAGARRGGAV